MSDMLVKLYDIPEIPSLQDGISIKRACSTDASKIIQFARDEFCEHWANECAYALYNSPISCFIAVKDKKIVGFACYDATAKGFFGPIGLLKTERGNKTGSALLLSCLHAMRNDGYAYAVVGWVGDANPFYEKAANAVMIPDSPPTKSIYFNMIEI
jgi:predicted N-acetyltransferase YhbS